jgi:hypothetical protein
MARELRKAARDSGEDVAAHHGLVKMIPQWERGARAPRERYRLLYLKVFQEALGGLSQGMVLGTDFALRLAEVRSRAASLPGPGQIRALEAAALAQRREIMTPAKIRALAAVQQHDHALVHRAQQPGQVGRFPVGGRAEDRVDDSPGAAGHQLDQPGSADSRRRRRTGWSPCPGGRNGRGCRARPAWCHRWHTPAAPAACSDHEAAAGRATA